MDFLNKLYSNNNFGIGLFCVIAFLVVMFLIVLFFGKRDEKKRKMMEDSNFDRINQEPDAFKETSTPTPVEVPQVLEPMMDAPSSVVSMEPVMPVEPIHYEPTEQEAQAIESSNPVNTEFVQNLNVNEAPIIEPITIEPQIVEPVPQGIEPISLNKEEPVHEVTPEVKPVTIEPIRIQVPVEPISNVTINQTPIQNLVNEVPVIEEEVKPIVTPIIEEPVTQQTTYYQPVEPVEAKKVDVPNIDFDAIAKSISKELDELEKGNHSTTRVTPMEEITQKNSDQFSSVYVNEPVKVTVAPKTKIELPKRIELPATKKGDNIEPESYQI